MPMINSKVTVSLPQEKRDILKAELGKAVAILGKPESYLMLGFEDNYDLYFGGKKLEKGAFISVEVLGDVDSEFPATKSTSPTAATKTGDGTAEISKLASNFMQPLTGFYSPDSADSF